MKKLTSIIKFKNLINKKLKFQVQKLRKIELSINYLEIKRDHEEQQLQIKIKQQMRKNQK